MYSLSPTVVATFCCYNIQLGLGVVMSNNQDLHNNNMMAAHVDTR